MEKFPNRSTRAQILSRRYLNLLTDRCNDVKFVTFGINSYSQLVINLSSTLNHIMPSCLHTKSSAFCIISQPFVPSNVMIHF
jgi:hypothetical protein